MDKQAFKSFSFVLSGANKYLVDISKLTKRNNLYFLLVKEDMQESILVPTNMYSFDFSDNSITINISQTDYKYGMICEEPEFVSFSWNTLTSLADLHFEQLNDLYNNFKTLSMEVNNMFTNSNYAVLVNNIDRAKYVFPKLKTGEVFKMGNEGLEAFDLEEIYRKYKVIFEEFNSLLGQYRQTIIDYSVTLERQESNIEAQIIMTNALQETLKEQEIFYQHLLDTLNTISVGDLTNLTTTVKTDLVGAINEIDKNTDDLKLYVDTQDSALDTKINNEVLTLDNRISTEVSTLNTRVTDEVIELNKTINRKTFLSAILYG